jgi:hypothetical protein
MNGSFENGFDFWTGDAWIKGSMIIITNEYAKDRKASVLIQSHVTANDVRLVQTVDVREGMFDDIRIAKIRSYIRDINS